MRRPRQLLRALLPLLLLAATCPAQEGGEERLSSLLEGRVTFTLPSGWVLQRHVSTKTNGRAELFIPHPEAGEASRRARVSLIANTVPEGVTVRQLGDGVYKNLYEGLSVVSDKFDGDDWRTMVWTTRSGGVLYTMFHRFGLVNRASVELMVAVPVPDAGDPGWLGKAAADFNAACASLKIDGRSRFDSPVQTGAVLPDHKKVNPKL